MGKKNKKVPPSVDRKPIVDRKKVPPIVIKQPIVPIIDIIDKKPDIADVSAAAALADTEQKPILIKTEADSLIAGEKLGIDLKDVGIGKSIEGAPLLLSRNRRPNQPAETVPVTILSRKKSKYV